MTMSSDDSESSYDDGAAVPTPRCRRDTRGPYKKKPETNSFDALLYASLLEGAAKSVIASKF
jgi:hypothetical protein